MKIGDRQDALKFKKGRPGYAQETSPMPATSRNSNVAFGSSPKSGDSRALNSDGSSSSSSSSTASSVSSAHSKKALGKTKKTSRGSTASTRPKTAYKTREEDQVSE